MLACVLPHAGAERTTRELAQRNWAVAARSLAEPALAAAQARGRQYAPEDLAAEVLAEPGGL
jgi:hypothetical protein